MRKAISTPRLALGLSMVSALVANEAQSGSAAFESVSLVRAASFSKRIVVGKVTARSSFHFPGSAEYQAQPKGKSLHYTQVKLLKVLKGAAGNPGEDLRIFSEAEWFRHTHAAALQGGVVSYVDSHYAGRIREDGIKDGVALIFFLGDTPAPSGFPHGAVFMAFGESYDLPNREKEVVAVVKNGPFAEFDHLIAPKQGQKIRFSDGLEIEVKGHSHKRPTTDGPRRQTAEVQLTKDGKSEMIGLGHVIDPDGSETWATQKWGDYSIELKGLIDDVETTLVVRKNRR